jgi:uncharacterized protein (TIGR02217 family)
MFLDSPRFPDDIAYGSEGGPEYLTEIIELNSGHEKRNAVWSLPRYKYNVAYGVRTRDQLISLIEFFHSVQGRAHGFRFKDHMDFKSGLLTSAVTPTDQLIGTGDGSTTQFQLKKNYTKGLLTRQRNIYKPSSGSVRVSLNGSEQLSGWSVDANGLVTFTSAPGNGVLVRAGFEYDVPCRFVNDYLTARWEDYELMSADVPIVEIRL